MAQLFGRSGRTGDVPVGRRAVASLALVAGALSGVVTSAAAPVGAAPAEVNLICTGATDDVAGTQTDLPPGLPEDAGGFSSSMVLSQLMSRMNQERVEPDGPIMYVPKLSFAASATLEHDLPTSMLTGDAPAPVSISGSMRLAPDLLSAIDELGINGPVGVDATNRAELTGDGVTNDQAEDVAPTSLTQALDAAPLEFPVDLAVTATPTADGGPAQLDYFADVALTIDQEIEEPFGIDIGTVSMTCTTAGPPQPVTVPEGYGDPGGPDVELQIAAPQPLADTYVAAPDGVIARTDRGLISEFDLAVDVLANDEALATDRSIDPSSLEILDADGPADVSLVDNRLAFESVEIPYSESPYGQIEFGFAEDPMDFDDIPFVPVAGFSLFPMFRTKVTYRVCDDGDPETCADGFTEVIMPMQIGDICDDPNIDVDCGPFEPPVDTTCTDDKSICEVPGCSWSDEEGRYVCTYPGKLQADPNDPPSDPNGPPSSTNDPPSGNGPGRLPSPGTPLTPAFTA
jgi:hypothetical protein